MTGNRPATVPGGSQRIQTNSNVFKLNQFRSNFIRFEHDLPELKKFEIKYGFERFNERNNFPCRKFLRLKLDFELKITKASRVWNSMEFALEPQDLMNIGQKSSVWT
jgi:hypothetical protein